MLGIEPTGERLAISSAYGRKLKTLKLSAPVDSFTQLRNARDEALRQAEDIAATAPEPTDDAPEEIETPEIPDALVTDDVLEDILADDDASDGLIDIFEEEPAAPPEVDMIFEPDSEPEPGPEVMPELDVPQDDIEIEEVYEPFEPEEFQAEDAGEADDWDNWDEQPADRDNSPAKKPPSIWKVPIAIFAAIYILGKIFNGVTGGAGNADDQPPPPRVPFEIAVEIWTAEQKNALLVELFGSAAPAGQDLLTSSNGDLWQVARSFTAAPHSEVQAQRANEYLAQALRSTVQAAAPNAPYDQLLAIKQIKLEMMQLSREIAGVYDCAEASRTGQLPIGTQVPEELRQKERAIALTLLEAVLLGEQGQSGDQESTADRVIPPTVWQEVLRRSGLEDGEAARAASGEGTNTAQCAFRIALAQEVLLNPSESDLDLLRIL